MNSREGIRLVAFAFGVALCASPSRALAVDLPEVGGKAMRLDVTETTIVAQRFNARDGEDPKDLGYFAWLNRLNLTLDWNSFIAGARLDSAVYAFRPEDRSYATDNEKQRAVIDGASRYRDSLYPAKLWLSYKKNGIELTAGDAYVQFGRGLILSMRKLDELGVDTTLFGGKATFQKDPVSLTVVAGLANPARVDEASGRALFLPKPVADDPLSPQPIFGSDRIVGASVQAGRGLPIVLSTNAVRLTRCAPYRYDASGAVVQGAFDAPVGSCDPADTTAWLSTLPTNSPMLTSSEAVLASQTLEVPSLWGHGNLFVEAAIQHRDRANEPDPKKADGNAVYASVSANAGPVTDTLEWKSYRNYYPLSASVNSTYASAFGAIAYSNPPTAEVITQDNMYGFYNVCVNGGRNRTDVRLSKQLLVYGAVGYFKSQSEIIGGGCDRNGTPTNSNSIETDTFITDLLGGIEWRFNKDRSYLFTSTGFRNDVKGTGDVYYQEKSLQYTLSVFLGGQTSLEFAGRHRLRLQDGENLLPGTTVGSAWWQGEHLTALKIAPQWVFTQGVEYITQEGFPATYVNGSILYKFTAESNLRLFVGQQRGGLRCVSGVCRVFPAFEGARAELTLRF